MSQHTVDSTGQRVLSPAQLDAFADRGFTLLRAAFDPAHAAAARAILWAEMGMDPDDPRTWTQPRLHLKVTHREPPFLACYSDRVRAAFDQLCGVGRWQHPGGLGWWPITFPGHETPPWTPPAVGWHIDGSSFHHHLTSPEQGLLAIFLLSDLEPGDGGTALAPGSHRHTARVLRDAEPHGLSPTELNRIVHASPWTDVVEANGRAGDLLLCHPFLSHAGSRNCGQRVRFLCNVCLPLAAPMQLERADGAYSVVEQVIRDSLA